MKNELKTPATSLKTENYIHKKHKKFNHNLHIYINIMFLGNH